MLLVAKIIDVFKMNIECLSIKETVEYFELIYTSNDVYLPQVQGIIDIQNTISTRDKLKIYIECDGKVISKYNCDESINLFLDDFKESIEDEDDIDYKITININKNIDAGNVTVYNTVTFIKYLKELKLNNILHILNNIIKEYGVIYFRVDDDFNINTKSICFLKENNQINFDSNVRKKSISNRNQNCSYLNASEYELTAEDFILINESNNTELNAIFSKLAVIYSLIGICDVSVIKDEKITFIINGYRRIESSLIYNETFNNTLSEYIKIYNWIYNETNNTSCADKIGITRNVITASIIENKINSSSNGLFRSVCSAHSIYLKENVKQYLEVKEKISEFNFDLMQKMGELSKEIGKSIFNNILVVGSFYGTVFVMNNITDEKFDNFFTRDITTFSLFIWFFSILYMFYTIFNIKKEIEMFETRYERAKDNYSEILNDEDIQNIFKDDRYFNEDKKFIKERTKTYLIIWIILIIILMMLIYHLGYTYVIELIDGIKAFFCVSQEQSTTAYFFADFKIR